MILKKNKQYQQVCQIHKEKLLMVCTHVIDEGEPIGDIDEDIRDDTIICQKCIDKMVPDGDETKGTLPQEVHLSCRKCVEENARKHLK